MSLLAWGALWGLLLLALPIIVHLFKPRKVRATPFSSLRWLKQAHQRLSRRIQWHQWLLFALRAGFILLLVVALARPLFGVRGAGKPTDRFVVLDVSPSMAYESGGMAAPLERARDLATAVMARSQPGDRTALVLAGSNPRLAAPLAADTAPAQAALQGVRAEGADSSVSSVLPLVRALTANAGTDRDVELIFLTANRQRSWQHSDIQTFLRRTPAPPRVEVVDLGPASVQNAWIAGARLVDPGADEDRRLRVEIGCVGDLKQERTLHLTGLDGLDNDAQRVVLSPGQTARVDFKLPAKVKLSGQVPELRLEPPDAVPADDHLFVNLDPRWALRVLLVEPESAGPEVRGAGLYLRAGVDALALSGTQSLRPTTRTTKGVTEDDVRKADVIVLAGAAPLSAAVLESLESRVRGGAGLVVFLGSELDAGFCNQKLFHSLKPADGLLPAPLKTGPESVKQGEPGLLTGIHWAHPLLAPLRDPLLGDLTLCRFRKYATFAAEPGKRDAVLARVDDLAPALIEHPLGKGRVLIWNTSADDTWSDLPRSRSFLPLLDRTLTYLAAGGVHRQPLVGEAVTVPLAEWQPGDEVVVTGPGGDKRPSRVLDLGGQALLHLGEVTEPGAYTVEWPGKTDKGFRFAVNTGRDGSPLTPADGKTLEQWWSPASFELLGADAAAERWSAGSGGWPVWPWLMLGGCLLLLAETVYVYRLCPRLNPTVAESVVPRRGMLRPVSSGETH